MWRKIFIWFSYIYNFIVNLSRVYNEPIQRPAPSWLVSLTGGALHRYRRGQGFESRTSLNFFQAFFSQVLSCVYNCDDLPSYNSHIYDFHIITTSVLFITQTSDRMLYFLIFQDKLHSVNIQDDQSWAFSETVQRKFPKSHTRPAGSRFRQIFSANCGPECLNEHYAST